MHASPPASGVVYSEVRRPCRVMILVNPHSGRGQALQLFSGHVQGMLTEAAVPYKLVITGQRALMHKLKTASAVTLMH